MEHRADRFHLTLPLIRAAAGIFDIGIIRLNRPARMNAVIEEMYLELQDVLKISNAALR